MMKRPSVTRSWILRGTAVLIAVYGVYAFHVRQIEGYLLLKTPFVFFDFNEPPVFFFLDYLSVMGLFVYSGHYLVKVLRKGISNIK